jgi:PAS domain S-box-containing protein
VNDAYCKLVKIPREELLGQVFSITYRREGSTDDLSLYQKRFDTGETITNLLGSATLRSGEVVHLEVTSSFIEITGHGRMLLSLFRDITQRKRSEEALRQAQKSESIGTLAGGIAHDFNNLLNAMLGQSSLALGKLAHESPARTHIEKSIKAAERAADLTRQLLAYSGKGRFLVEEIDLNLVVKENVQILEVSVPKTTQIRFELGSPTPRIQGDVGQIQQIVMNLIINAGEAVGPNPGTITVRTGRVELTQNETKYWKYSATTLAPGRYAYLQVADNGHVMKAEVLDRIFDPFFTTKFTGRGLGLAAVLGIIRGHKGGVHITSEEGTGTQFDVVFPLAAASTTADVEKSKKAHQVEGEGKTILLIDDEAFVLELLTDIFTEEKFTVISALNPVEGIELYVRHQQSIAMIVLDYSMPGMDGKATFEELVKINKDVKVLLCSGYTEEEMESAFGDVRPSGFIHKPYQPAELLERISRVLAE